MEKAISVPFSSKLFPNVDAYIVYRIEPQGIELADWIAHLCLLSNHHIDGIVVNS
jgi:hypothetical protein